MNKEKNTKPKILSGTVVSNKMKDTVVVSVERYEKHPKYGKFIKQRKKFKAHDTGNTKSIGDKVEIVESKPISKDKHFIVK
jgi:small subunit ribosomal protein S17